MNLKLQLDEVEQICLDQGKSKPDRFTLMKWMASELQELTTKLLNVDWFLKKMTAIPCVVGTRTYALPSDFPANFIPHAAQRFYQPLLLTGDKYCCIMNDGSKDGLIEYESQAQFYSRNLYGEPNGRPSVYTITYNSDGSKNIVLSVPPDSTSYTVSGLYEPTSWTVTDETQIPTFPANSPVLKYGVMRRLIPAFQQLYQDALGQLMLMAAQDRPTQFVPVLGRSGLNEYTLMRRR